MSSEKIGVHRVALSRGSGHVGSCGPNPVYAVQPVRRNEFSAESTVSLSRNEIFFLSYNMAPLHNAALSGNLAAVRRLINAGASVNARNNNNNMTPLMFAAYGGHAPIIRHLINRGANARARQTQNDPKTALIYAVERGNINSVRALLRHSNLNAQDANGRSALTTAANLNKRNLVRMLVRAGAKPNAFTLEYINGQHNVRNLMGSMLVRRTLLKKAIRAAKVARRTHAMRGQLGSVRVQTGSTYVNRIPVHVLNTIAAHMRRG
jgi:hypothetical protein